MSFVVTHQIALIAGFFLAGLIGTAALLRLHASSRAWRLADLVWVLLGGLGALTAVIAGVYKADSSRLDRQIDIAYSATQEFETEAARFRLLYCDGAVEDPDVVAAVNDLCEKVEFLSASTAENQELPLFLEVARITSPLQGLQFLARSRDAGTAEHDEMMKAAEDFDAARFLAFAAEDDATKAAAAQLSADPEHQGIAVEFRLIAASYDRLIGQVGRLKTEWEFLQANSRFLTAQIIALCMVAFAAPFRLGKSVVELL